MGGRGDTGEEALIYSGRGVERGRERRKQIRTEQVREFLRSWKTQRTVKAMGEER